MGTTENDTVSNVTVSNDTVPEVASRMIAAIEAGDGDGFLACYAPGAVIWHNNDNLEQEPAMAMKVLAWLRKRVDGLRYEEIRAQPTPSGYVQQHVLRGTARDGSAFEVPACLVVTVAGGLITRLDEYIDTSGLGYLSSL
jgi:ketosteroid isomerase-like protein